MRAHHLLIALGVLGGCTKVRQDLQRPYEPTPVGSHVAPPGTPEPRPDVAIREWDAPGHPHDPAVAPDGALWYTAQRANALGRIDPRTGARRVYRLPVADSGPHGLVADPHGNIWFTANAKAYIGKLEPRTGEVTEYRMPDPRARDPHTPVFGADGNLYFTVQEGNFVGRLEVASGKVTLVEVPTPNAQPYGIVATPGGALYFCEFGTNKIGRLDPARMEIVELVLPDRDARPRRLVAAQGGGLYFTDFAGGHLGHVDPEFRITELPSPGGARSQPYAIAQTPDGVVWFVETGVSPNQLVRFDPHTQEFQRWPIPSGGGVVRNMVATAEGRLYLAESGANKVAVATIAGP